MDEPKPRFWLRELLLNDSKYIVESDDMSRPPIVHSAVCVCVCVLVHVCVLVYACVLVYVCVRVFRGGFCVVSAACPLLFRGVLRDTYLAVFVYLPTVERSAHFVPMFHPVSIHAV